MQFIHQELEHNLWQIENIDSRIFEDTQCVIQETANETYQIQDNYKQVRQVIAFKHSSE